MTKNMSVAGTEKRKRFSRNKKKNWRKVDISEVEEHLEDERLQERTGGLVAEKTNDELFFIQKNDSSSKTLEKEGDETKGKRKKPKPLKCHAHLLPDSKIKPARVNKNAKPIKRKLTEKEKKNVITKTEILAGKQSKKARKESFTRKRIKYKQQVADYDLWNTDITASDADPYYLLTTKQRRVKTPASYNEKPSALPAVAPPHPGASYNPTYEDFQELMSEAHEVEVKKLKAEEKLNRSLDAKFPLKEEYDQQKTWLNEMSTGLGDENSDSSESESESNDRLSANPPVRREDYKTRQQKKKAKKLKFLAVKKMKKQKRKTEEQKVFRIKSLNKDIAKLDRQQQLRQEKIAKLKELDKVRTKKLGRTKFTEPDIAVKLSDELVSSLRLLKPEGNLLTDRYQSLQKRNIMPARPDKKIKTKKYKRKVFVKRSHRTPV